MAGGAAPRSPRASDFGGSTSAASRTAASSWRRRTRRASAPARSSARHRSNFSRPAATCRSPARSPRQGGRRSATCCTRRAPLPVGATVERWVLDDASLPADDASLRAQVLQTYFDEYTRRWMSFLDELKVKTPTDVPTATAELAAFKEGDGFYKTLFDAFKRNAIHDEESHGLLDALDAGGLLSRIPWFKSEADAAAKAAHRPRPSRAAFARSSCSPASPGRDGAAPAQRLGARRSTSTSRSSTSSRPSSRRRPHRRRRARRARAVQRGEHGRRSAARRDRGADARSPVATPHAARDGRRVGGEGRRSRPRSPTTGSRGSGRPGTRSSRDTFRSPLTPKPPISASSRRSSSRTALLWGFVKTHLADRVEENGEGRYVVKQGADPVSGELLGCLSIAREITRRVLRCGRGPRPQDLRSGRLDRVERHRGEVLGRGQGHARSPRASGPGRSRWLGEDVRIEWQEDGRPTQELGRHSFSLFDLFEHLGGLRPTGSGRSIYASDCPPSDREAAARGQGRRPSIRLLQPASLPGRDP